MKGNDLQIRLMPFLITTISVMAIIYMVFFFIETNEIQKDLAKSPSYQKSLPGNSPNLQQTKWDNLYTLEQFTLENKEYRARLIIRSRVLIISLSFLTGITLSIIGAIFILSKYSEDTSNIEGGTTAINLKLKSSSPGIILTFFGVLLIAISIFSKTNLDIVDAPVYLNYSFTDSLKSAPAVQPATNVLKLQQSHPVAKEKKKKVDNAINNLIHK